MTQEIFQAVLSALCFIESGNNPAAINIHDGAGPSYGLCQVKISTARLLGFKGHASELWFNPVTNMYWAGQYLQKQLKRYGTIEKAIAAYNAGRVKYNANGQIVNRAYVAKVLNRMKESAR